MRLIDADALMNELNEAQIEFDEYYKGLGKAKVITDNALTVDLELIIKALEQEPKTGHWIVGTDLGYYVSTCSNCDWLGHGSEVLIYKPKYCPNCGARMREKNE